MCRWIEPPSRHAARREPVPEPRPARAASPYRVSDAEREEVIAQLRTHTADGRLTLEEFEGRVEEAWKARTGPELDATLRELPPPAGPAPAAARPRRLRAERPALSPLARRFLFAAGLVLAVWLLAGHLVVWPFFVGFFVFGGCAPGFHHRHRDRPEPRREDAVTYV